jgi:hypothetical protein
MVLLRRYVEYLNELDFDETDNTSFNFLDSALSYSGSAASNHYLDYHHLEGQVVAILADGCYTSKQNCKFGFSITLDRSAKKCKSRFSITHLYYKL